MFCFQWGNIHYKSQDAFLIKDPMPPFVAKFCPVLFGWDNALMLNCMQWAVECEPERTNWPFKSVDVSLCELSGTVEDADILSLHFTHHKGFIKKTIVGCNTQMDAALRLEFQEVFAGRCTVSSFDASILVNGAVRRLRENLCRMFSSVDAPFSAVFSPARFGWHDALMLNSMQWAYHLIPRNARFTRMIGTQADAHWLSHVFQSPSHSSSYQSIRNSMELQTEFSGETLCRLRVRLYAAPRSVAFMMGKHRGGLVASLSDDLCRMILALSLE